MDFGNFYVIKIKEVRFRERICPCPHAKNKVQTYSVRPDG
jgi:hypothetical protein